MLAWLCLLLCYYGFKIVLFLFYVFFKKRNIKEI